MWPVVILLFGGGILFAKKGINYMKNQNIGLNNKNFFFFPSSFNKNLNNLFLKNDMKGFERNMSKSEAYKILNINPTSNKEKIREVHKQLMLKNHPDNGGSTYIAAKVNEAKDVLLK
ncbi:mitochondrial import inner membrane translocase subunit TIM14, putative [Plasmodium ovale]|uniref:Mitochondrial import inner membrane translocase subunit TIM14, putative n=1 Tax=Plasmodium ovale TaxID=36330 RepID=A0A1C3KNE3_PLAOA|nr:mitochondrial import inner membrane translocase subunit TIM14, putative [Plasmodium ovale]